MQKRPPTFWLNPSNQLAKGGIAFAGLSRFTGTSLFYDSASAGHGTLTGMTPSTAWARDIGRPTLTTDGVNHYIDTAPILRQPGNFWVSAWVNAAALTNVVGCWIANQRTDDADGVPAWWQLAWDQGTDKFYCTVWDSSDNYKLALSPVYTTLNTWANVIGYVSGGNVKFSLNGVETVGDAIGTVKTPTALKMRIGMQGFNYPTVKYGWNGKIADVIVGNGILTDAMRGALADPTNVMYHCGGSDLLVYRPRRSVVYVSGGAPAGVRFSPWILKTRRQRIGA